MNSDLIGNNAMSGEGDQDQGMTVQLKYGSQYRHTY
jgi:hypothetical protein